MADHKQIGEVAEIVGLSLRTIRHYDEVGIVPPSARSKGGFRLYTDADVARLLLVKRMKPLGFSLEEMRDLLGVVDALERPRVEAKRRTQLLARLAMYHQAARQRADDLREQVGIAEELCERLAGQVARHSAAVPRQPKAQDLTSSR